MKFEEVGLSGKTVQFSVLEHLLSDLGFVLAGQWDYERATYDYKFEDMVTGDVYYLRVQGIAVEGEIPNKYAQVKLLTPLLGKYYYPHGVEYGDEEFPKNILEQSKRKLQAFSEALEV
jgi:hypothetical protein